MATSFKYGPTSSQSSDFDPIIDSTNTYSNEIESISEALSRTSVMDDNESLNNKSHVNASAALGPNSYGNIVLGRQKQGGQSSDTRMLSWISNDKAKTGESRDNQQNQDHCVASSNSVLSESQSNMRTISPPFQRKRGASIDEFLSQNLGSEFLKFRNDVHNGNAKSVVEAEDSFDWNATAKNKSQPPPGFKRDLSPPSSLTGTSASSRSDSPPLPSYSGEHYGRRFSLPTTCNEILNIVNHHKETPPPLSGTHISNSNRTHQEQDGLNLGHQTNNSRHEVSGHHANNPPQVSSSNGDYRGSYTRRAYAEEDSIGHNTTSPDRSFLPHTGTQSSRHNFEQGLQNHYIKTQSGHLQFAVPQTQNQQYQPIKQEAMSPQVFYMAVPTEDGRGQVLQPIQMVQLPGQPPALVLPAGLPPPLPGNEPSPSLAYNKSETNQVMVMTPNQISMAGSNKFVSSTSEQRLENANNSRNENNPRHNSITNIPYVRQQINANVQSNLTAEHNGSKPSFIAPSQYSEDANRNNFKKKSGYVDHVYSHGEMNGLNKNEVSTNQDFISSLYASTHRPPLEDLIGHVRRLSRDQVGCRLLQQSLDEEGAKAATLILNEGLTFWGEAMVDPFGNYLFQKILEKITLEERVVLIKNVSNRLVNASLNLHGTRSVQKVVELCAMDENILARRHHDVPCNSSSSTEILTQALGPAAARLCIDSHGNHVIQRILLKLPYQHSQFVFDAVAASVEDVARHRHGCCVIQRCLDSCPSAARSHLIRRIVDKSLELMQDAYGNYVVQYVLDVCCDEDVYAVCESVVGKVNLLAIQKFSSNVMEKCLERCTDKIREQYLAEISQSDRIRELMIDPFGNYVIQRALSVASHSQAISLVEAMRPHLISAVPGNGIHSGGMRNTAGGRRIMSKICKRFPNFNLGSGTFGEEQNTSVHYREDHTMSLPFMMNNGPYKYHNGQGKKDRVNKTIRQNNHNIQQGVSHNYLGGNAGYKNHVSRSGGVGYHM
mmetsp:Transcript_19592/g.27564  ORF Transcript_19592/g.27564 Transcript_19592/m.27564 type:complete len:1000 (-) Transcript_19592:257-3256(-)|eukprot:CAMPEP_0184864516 /NCGR_PEP_ID=MMETSP0580-20130426/15254_1 /TAXON_ID=1118495 /ORGANISM="Dactyliosolen fragilissimus" /LENGTH=999 /DNA_ID=CAMNT_0027363347 /DNA_START=184 /DNA_END=3183 /DNA_ORIENTATION=+